MEAMRKWPPIIPQAKWLLMSESERREALDEWSSAPVLNINNIKDEQWDYDNCGSRKNHEWGE